TWDGAPLPCAVGLAVLDVIHERRLVERVRERGPRLLDELRASLQGSSIVGEVRGRGFLLGVDLVDPRDGRSFLPDELDAAALVDDIAFGLDLLVSSTHSTQDGYAGDEVLLAPAYTSSDAELGQMVERFATTIASLERKVLQQLGRQPVATARGS
ncbi:MAG: aminotransferase class III-fold pyridoxal phosphate-dependent enzyme, partial [Chloroflexi bacterium]